MMYKTDSMTIIETMYEDMQIVIVLMKYISNALIMNLCENMKKKLHMLLEICAIMFLGFIMIVSLSSVSLTYLSIDSQLLSRYVMRTVATKTSILKLMLSGRKLPAIKRIVSNWYTTHLLSIMLTAKLDTIEPSSVESTMEPDIDKVPPLR